MGTFQIISLAARIAGILDGSDPRLKRLKGDQLLYVIGRELALRLQSRNPGIAEAAGYTSEIDS